MPVITVGGTNGKGSTCALLAAVLDAAGFRTGVYTSPHLVHYRERVRLAGGCASDAQLVEAFEAVETARGATTLTYFEHGTLAAAWLFARAGLDALVLEVGLGGRLDAVNVFDPDCAVITSIGIDHVEFLGPTRESIAFEKAGIFRSGRPAVVAERDVPAPMREHAQRVGARALWIGSDFDAEPDGPQWRWRGPDGQVRGGLPHPALRGPHQLGNAAAAVTALDTLRDRLPVSAQALRTGLVTAELPGRFQVLPGRPVVVLDVAHNPHGAERLATALGAMQDIGRTHAVFAMLADKDIEGVVRAVRAHVDVWHLAPLPGPRGAGVAQLQAALDAAHVLDEVVVHATVLDAYRAARAHAALDARVVVFGSFHTVAPVLGYLAAPPHDSVDPDRIA